MTETLKKKPDFKNLDLSKITGPTVNPLPKSNTIEVEPVVSTNKQEVKEGVWINGKSNEDVTPQEFIEWLSNLLPGVGVEKFDNINNTTPKDRERIILRLSLTLHKVFQFPRNTTVNDKKYVN